MSIEELQKFTERGNFKWNEEDFAKACEGSLGNIKLIARKLALPYKAVYGKIYIDPKYMEIWMTERNKIIDTAESELFKHIKAGNLDAIKFALKTIGRHRGYVEEVQTKSDLENTRITIQIIDTAISQSQSKELLSHKVVETSCEVKNDS